MATILGQLGLEIGSYKCIDHHASDLQTTQSICVTVKGCARYLLTDGRDDCTRRSTKRGPQMRTPRAMC